MREPALSTDTEKDVGGSQDLVLVLLLGFAISVVFVVFSSGPHKSSLLLSLCLLFQRYGSRDNSF